jgi:Domain of unknown function (DUF4337)
VTAFLDLVGRTIVSHEITEHIEHAGHDGHESGHGGAISRWIGITIAILGVLLAVCSAQLGAARTELITTMVEENAAKSKYAAVATKYRMLQAELQHLHAAMPNLDDLEKKDTDLNTLQGEVKSEDVKQELKAFHLHMAKVLNTVIPTPTDVERFLIILDDTRKETEAARKWSESYRDAVEVHKDSAEHFEYALLCAEIGIVVASVGLLLGKQVLYARVAFATALVLGLLSLSIAAGTFAVNKQKLLKAEPEIMVSESAYEKTNKDEQDIAEDEKLEDEVRKDLPRLRKLLAGL